MNEGILVLVTNPEGPSHLLRVTTTTDGTQARWDAYCYITGDENPSQQEVDQHTSIPDITLIGPNQLIGRSSQD